MTTPTYVQSMPAESRFNLGTSILHGAFVVLHESTFNATVRQPFLYRLQRGPLFIFYTVTGGIRQCSAILATSIKRFIFRREQLCIICIQLAVFQNVSLLQYFCRYCLCNRRCKTILAKPMLFLPIYTGLRSYHKLPFNNVSSM